MNTLIGSLLVVSLLSRPSVNKAGNMVYQMITPKTEIVYILKSLGKEESEVCIIERLDSSDNQKSIEESLDNINENSSKIQGLMKEKTNLIAKTQTRLDLLSFAKKPLTDKQMKSFSDFYNYYEKENSNLENEMKLLYKNDGLNKVKKEIMKKESNINLIKEDLMQVESRQLDAIDYLSSIIGSATELLECI